MIAIVIILLVVVLLYVLSVRGRKGFDGLSDLQGWYYAHRGLHSEGVPENSMAAFRAAKEGGYGVELDVHLMADGNLAVIHDSSLKRTAGVDVVIEDLTAPELANYRLEGTDERIPLLSQVLNMFQGTVPVIVELKSYGGNCNQLCDAAHAVLREYEGSYCIESYDPRCVVWLRTAHNDVIRGQLAENFFLSKSRISNFLKFTMRHQILNVLSKPDFVAYRFEDRHTISNFIARKIWGMQGVAWTIRTQEDLDTAVREGWIPIFENFRP